jgi:hypothetical protein
MYLKVNIEGVHLSLAKQDMLGANVNQKAIVKSNSG